MHGLVLPPATALVHLGPLLMFFWKGGTRKEPLTPLKSFESSTPPVPDVHNRYGGLMAIRMIAGGHSRFSWRINFAGLGATALCSHCCVFVCGVRAQALLIKMFQDEPDGGSGVSLSLAELLALKGEPQLVFANDSARGASKAIARGRKAVSPRCGVLSFPLWINVDTLLPPVGFRSWQAVAVAVAVAAAVAVAFHRLLLCFMLWKTE